MQTEPSQRQRKRQAKVLGPTQSANARSACLDTDDPRKTSPCDELHQLSENCLASIDDTFPNKSIYGNYW